MRMMKMRNAPEVDYSKVAELLKTDFMPMVNEVIHSTVANAVEEFSGKKLTRVEALERYLSTLYEAQRAGHEAHKEIAEALSQFRKEVGL